MHAILKSAGGQRQSKRKDRVLISHSLECESQESSVIGDYLDGKVCILQVQRKEPVPWPNLREDLFQCDQPEQRLHEGTI